nr:ATP-binding cassette domain-containing protein [Flammeovirgaceae bacterium]
MKLRAENLVKKYKSRTVVNHVSVEVNQGEIVGLLGPNGAGKTTTFYMTVGLIKPNDGHIYLDQQDITALPMFERAKLGIGYLAQEASVFRKLTVEENILSVLEMRDYTKQQRKDKVEEMLEEFSLT